MASSVRRRASGVLARPLTADSSRLAASRRTGDGPHELAESSLRIDRPRCVGCGEERDRDSSIRRRLGRSLTWGTRSGADHLLTRTGQRGPAKTAAFNGSDRFQGGTKGLTCCIYARYRTSLAPERVESRQDCHSKSHSGNHWGSHSRGGSLSGSGIESVIESQGDSLSESKSHLWNDLRIESVAESRSESEIQSLNHLWSESLSHLGVQSANHSQSDSASDWRNDSWNDLPNASAGDGSISVRRSASGFESNTA